MITIWKYELAIQETCEVIMPIGAKILSLQTQNDIPNIWVEVDDSVQTETRTFKTYGTGHKINDITQKYIGTYVLHIGTYVLQKTLLVFHVYEVL